MTAPAIPIAKTMTRPFINQLSLNGTHGSVRLFIPTFCPFTGFCPFYRKCLQFPIHAWRGRIDPSWNTELGFELIRGELENNLFSGFVTEAFPDDIS